MNQKTHTVHCPYCSSPLRVPEAGDYRCPGCGGTFQARIEDDNRVSVSQSSQPPSQPEPPQEKPAEQQPPASKPAMDSVAPAEPPSHSATCENHPQFPATAVCQLCGKLVCDACLAEKGKRNICKPCFARQEAGAKNRGYAPPPTPDTDIKWEKEGKGFFYGFGDTITGALLRPTEFFSKMSPRDKVWRSFTFGVIMQTIAAWVSQLFFIASFRSFDISQFQELLNEMPPEFQDALQQVFEGSSFMATSMITGMIFAPLSAAASILVSALFLHLFLLLFRGAGSGLEATIKVASYASAANLIYMLPMCGGVIGWIWKIVITILGLAAVHRTTTGRAALAALMPVIILFFLMMIMLVMIVTIMLSAMG